eukprot:gene13485-biopygen2287
MHRQDGTGRDGKSAIVMSPNRVLLLVACRSHHVLSRIVGAAASTCAQGALRASQTHRKRLNYLGYGQLTVRGLRRARCVLRVAQHAVWRVAAVGPAGGMARAERDAASWWARRPHPPRRLLQ